MSKTGKASKKGKGSGRPTKERNISKLTEIFINEFPKDELRKIVKDYIQNNKEEAEELLKKIIKSSSLSLRDFEVVLNIPKTNLLRIKNLDKKQKDIYYEEKVNFYIKEIFFRNNGTRGREPIAAHLERDYGIKLSSRHVGRIMKKLGLICKTRIPNSWTKDKEQKNTKVSIPNLVNNDYDNLFHEEKILSSDSTYITATKDVTNQNHIFFSAVLSHDKKIVLGHKLSLKNDTQLAIDTIKDIELNNVIFHTDHGAIYSSNTFIELLDKKRWVQSMGNVGDSLSNREIEHFFGVFKTEFLNNLDVRKMTFEQLELAINNWIYYYNNFRIQKKLDWKAPIQNKNFI